MAEVKELKWFNWLSISFGIGLFIDGSKFVKFVNYSRSCTVLFSTTYMLVIHVLNNIDNSYTGNNVFWINLSSFTYFPGIIFYTIFFNMSRKEISSILISFLKFMTTREKAIMKWISIAVTIIALVHFFTYVISSLLLDQKVILKNQIMDTLLVNQTDIYMHGCGLCFIFILSSFFSHKNILEKINVNIHKPLNDKTIRQMVLSLLFIQSNMNRINTLSGPVLLLQFSTVYTAIPVVTLLAADWNGDYSWMTTEFVTTVVHILILLLLVAVVEKLTAKLQETQTEILVKLVGRKDIHPSYHMDTFMKLLQDKDLFKYTAMDMFDINYGMLLSFLGSVISLSVLICQVTDTKH